MYSVAHSLTLSCTFYIYFHDSIPAYNIEPNLMQVDTELEAIDSRSGDSVEETHPDIPSPLTPQGHSTNHRISPTSTALSAPNFEPCCNNGVSQVAEVHPDQSTSPLGPQGQCTPQSADHSPQTVGQIGQPSRIKPDCSWIKPEAADMKMEEGEGEEQQECGSKEADAMSFEPITCHASSHREHEIIVVPTVSGDSETQKDPNLFDASHNPQNPAQKQGEFALHSVHAVQASGVHCSPGADDSSFSHLPPVGTNMAPSSLPRSITTSTNHHQVLYHHHGSRSTDGHPKTELMQQIEDMDTQCSSISFPTTEMASTPASTVLHPTSDLYTAHEGAPALPVPNHPLHDPALVHDSASTISTLSCFSVSMTNDNEAPSMSSTAATSSAQQQQSSATISSSPRKIEVGVREYFYREKIPWNPGKVQKIREGINRTGHLASAVDGEGDGFEKNLPDNNEELMAVDELVNSSSLPSNSKGIPLQCGGKSDMMTIKFLINIE